MSEVIAVVRKSRSVENSKVTEFLAEDLSLLNPTDPNLKGDVYFCCLGTTIKTAGSRENFRAVDFDLVLKATQIPAAQSAKSFVLVSAFGVNPQSAVFYNKIKGQAEQAIQGLGLSHLVIFRPSLLLGTRSESRPGEQFAIRLVELVQPILPQKFRRLAGTPVNSLIKMMIDEGLHPREPQKIISAHQIPNR